MVELNIEGLQELFLAIGILDLPLFALGLGVKGLIDPLALFCFVLMFVCLGRAMVTEYLINRWKND